jgi:hypothetical protein
MRERRPYLKQKPILCFDENFPSNVVAAFCIDYWRPKIKVVTAIDEGHLGRSDRFHCAYCHNNAYTLVTQDLDFNNDRLYPFSNGKMSGIIMVRGDPSGWLGIYGALSQLIPFIWLVPYPKAFLTETKSVVSRDSAVVRGRDAVTKQIKKLHVKPQTTVRQLRQFFTY